jgi:hypothetical protein
MVVYIVDGPVFLVGKFFLTLLQLENQSLEEENVMCAPLKLQLRLQAISNIKRAVSLRRKSIGSITTIDLIAEAGPKSSAYDKPLLGVHFSK